MAFRRTEWIGYLWPFHPSPSSVASLLGLMNSWRSATVWRLVSALQTTPAAAYLSPFCVTCSGPLNRNARPTGIWGMKYTTRECTERGHLGNALNRGALASDSFRILT